ncbi:MAG TPA: histidine kinase [Bryobacteraceae bacterium]|nr:histidine kinase [Bryobacteraceae bacterium]
MNDKLPLPNKTVGGAVLDSALAEALFAAVKQHEQTLARVARLLHDDVSQVLSAAGLQLDALRMDFRETAPGVDQRAIEIQGMLEQAIDRLRGISNELSPSIAERAGLHFALDQLAGKARNDFAGVLRLHFDPSARVTPLQAAIFYRIAEYAIGSAMARDHCSLIEIQFKQSHGNLILEIADNGAYQSPDKMPKPLDLLLVEYYAANAGFALTRSGAPEGGNMLRASHPAANSATT